MTCTEANLLVHLSTYIFYFSFKHDFCDISVAVKRQVFLWQFLILAIKFKPIFDVPYKYVKLGWNYKNIHRKCTFLLSISRLPFKHDFRDISLAVKRKVFLWQFFIMALEFKPIFDVPHNYVKLCSNY